MFYGKIEKDYFEYDPDGIFYYFLSDGYVYAAFNTKLPDNWTELTEEIFVVSTREMYANTLTWGLGKPLIQIASTSRYGLVLLSDNVTDGNPLKVATADSVKLAYDIAVEAYNSVNSTHYSMEGRFEYLSSAKNSRHITSFQGKDVVEVIDNKLNGLMLADRITKSNPDRSIVEITNFYDTDGVTVKDTYTTTTSFTADGKVIKIVE